MELFVLHTTPFIPGIEMACPYNRRLVNGHEGQPIVSGTSKKGLNRAIAMGEIGLQRKQAFAATLTPDVLDRLVIEDTPSDWEDLTQMAHDAVGSAYEGVDLSDYAEACESTEEEVYDSEVEDAARGGISTATAFIEVIPRVLVNAGLEKPAEEAVDYAIRSKGFMIHWAGVRSDIDPALADYFARPGLPQRQSVFDNLRFDERLFKAEEGRIIPKQRVCFMPIDGAVFALAKNYKIKPSVILGCPGIRAVSRLFPEMVEAADRAGLLQESADEQIAK